MKTNVNYYTFREWFETNRPDNFSRYGLLALWEMLEEYEDSTGEEIEFDPISFCCDFSEYDNLEELKNNYSDIENFEDLQNETSVIKIPNTKRFIIQNY